MCICEGLPGLEGMVAWISAAKQLGTVSNAWQQRYNPSASQSALAVRNSSGARSHSRNGLMTVGPSWTGQLVC